MRTFLGKAVSAYEHNGQRFDICVLNEWEHRVWSSG